MSSVSVIRRIDDLGRIVIPKEIRKKLKIRDNDELEINVVDTNIVLNKYSPFEDNQMIRNILETINKTTKNSILFTTTDKIIYYVLQDKNETVSMELNDDIIKIIEARQRKIGHLEKINFIGKDIETSYIIEPIIKNGDLYGSLIIYGNNDFDKNIYSILDFVICFFKKYLD